MATQSRQRMTTPATVPQVVVQRHWQCAVSACDHWDIAQTWDPRQGKEVLDVCFKDYDYDRNILKDDKQEMQDQLETLHHLHHLIATKFVHGVMVPNGHSAVLSPLRLTNLRPYWDATSTCSYTLAFIWHGTCGSSEASLALLQSHIRVLRPGHWKRLGQCGHFRTKPCGRVLRSGVLRLGLPWQCN